MTRILNALKGLGFRQLVRMSIELGWYAPIVSLLAITIREHPANSQNEGGGVPTLLALSPEGFKGDLDGLARSGRFRVLLASTAWQWRLFYAVHRRGLRTRDYLNPEAGGPVWHAKKRLQTLYRNVLPRLYRKLGVNCVISYHIRMPADADWGIVSREIGVPYVVLYREGLIAAAPILKTTMKTLFDRFGFWGTHLIVHNESARDLCIESGFVGPDQVSALGCIRMDRFLARIKNTSIADNAVGSAKMVSFFPITLGQSARFGAALEPYHNEVHVALGHLAKELPNVSFVIKPKPKIHSAWKRQFQRSLSDAGIDIDRLTNLSIDSDLDAQALIFKSTVVCGLNSTTLLESAIAGRPVIVPYFQKLRSPPFRDAVRFLDAYDYFDVAADADEFVRLIRWRLQDTSIPERVMTGRRQMFRKYVSDPDGGAVDRYAATLMTLMCPQK